VNSLAKFGLLAALAGGIFFAFRNLKGLANIEVNPVDAAISKQETTLKGNTVIYLTLGFYNPNTTDLSFEQFVGSFFINNTKISNVDYAQRTTLPARATTPIKIKLSVPTTTFITNVGLVALDILKGTKNTKSRLDGQVKASGIWIPTTTTYDLKLK